MNPPEEEPTLEEPTPGLARSDEESEPKLTSEPTPGLARSDDEPEPELTSEPTPGLARSDEESELTSLLEDLSICDEPKHDVSEVSEPSIDSGSDIEINDDPPVANLETTTDWQGRSGRVGRKVNQPEEEPITECNDQPDVGQPADPEMDVLELLKKLSDNTELARELIAKNMPKTLAKEEFLDKLEKSPCFRAQLFGEYRIYQTARASVNMDKLYEEYASMKLEKIGILSHFIKDNILYISERIGDRVRVRHMEYDYNIIGFHSFPISVVMEPLPLDEDELSYWEMVSCEGCYTFNRKDKPLGKFLSVVKLHQIKKDVFLLHDELIVHVQDSDLTYESDKDQRVMSGLMEYMDALGSTNFEAILDRIIGDMPEVLNPE